MLTCDGCGCEARAREVGRYQVLHRTDWGNDPWGVDLCLPCLVEARRAAHGAIDATLKELRTRNAGQEGAPAQDGAGLQAAREGG